jgi:adenosylhomocysteine nucleosidase
MRADAAGAPSPAAAPRPLKALLLAALRREVRPFLRQFAARARQDLEVPAWELALDGGAGGAAALLLSGMGPDAASRAALAGLGRWRPETLISLGFGGAVTPELAPGVVVLGASFWQYDPETGDLRAAPTPPPPRPLTELRRRLQEAGLPAFAGSLVTTPGIIHKASQGQALRSLPGPVLDLETAPLAALAAARGLAFVGLRVITDGAADEIPDFLRQGWQAGADPGLAAALAWVGRDPRRLVPLLRLWRRSETGARRLARALEVLLPLLP